MSSCLIGLVSRICPDIDKLHYFTIQLLRGYSIIGFGSGFTVNLSSDSLGISNDLGVSGVNRIHFGFGFIVNPDPDPIIE